jgi:hypothetical protein
MDECIQKCLKLSESEWVQVKKSRKSTPFTSFSAATLKDLKRPDGLNLDLRNVENNAIMRPSLFLPDNIPAIVPSDLLCDYLDRLNSIWDFGTEMGCRSRIDAIIAEAIVTSGMDFKTYCEVKNDWSGQGFSYKGNVDYMIGAGGESFLMVVEAKKEWPDSAVAQVLAEAGCLLKNRELNGKSTPVFAVLTNSVFFQFFVIDTNSVVFTSGVPSSLSTAEDGSYKSSASLAQILRWMNWFIKSMEEISPPSSQINAESRCESVKQAVSELSKYFRNVKS